MAAGEKTIAEIIALGDGYLCSRGIAESRLKCEILLSRLLGIKRLALTLHAEQVLSEGQLAAMRRGLKRLSEGEPVQHVVGEAGFMQHIFKSDCRALIPRPETELLVQRVLDDPWLWLQENPAIVDVGTGSGCIVLSLAAARPAARYLAVDVSSDALALARENAVRLHLSERVTFLEGRLGDFADAEMLDAIVANLPYIPAGDLAGLDRSVRDFEPRVALEGGASGLEIVEDLVADAVIVLKSGGKLFLEIGEKQGALVRRLLEETGFGAVEVLRDLNGRDRVVTGTLD